MAKKFTAEDVGKGALVVAAGAAVGAGIGAALNPPCDTNNWLLCGPKVGAEFGAAYGMGTAFVGGLLVAAMSPKHRNVGLGTAAVYGGVFVAMLIKRAVAPPAAQTTTPAIG